MVFIFYLDPTTFKEPDCCSTESHETHHHNCFPIRIPRNDPFYKHHGQNCMNFARSLAGVRSECRLGKLKLHLNICNLNLVFSF